ncbi:MAG: VWA domain-containing protein [Vicinamibacterales bacterium]
MRARLFRIMLLGACLAILADRVVLGTATLADRAAAAQGPDPQERPTFRGGANLVLVDAYPQRKGKIVEGLSASDFDLLEDGKPQVIANFEFVRSEGSAPETLRRDPNNVREMEAMAADPHNRVFVSYLDTLQTTVEGSNRIRLPLVQTLNRLVGPEDLFGVMTPAMRAQDVTLARRMLTTEDQLSRYWSWGQRNGVVAADINEVGLAACFHDLHLENGATVPWKVAGDQRLLDEILIERRREDLALRGLEGLVLRLGTMREARSVVIVVSDGWILLPRASALTNEPPRDARSRQTRPMPGGRVEDGEFWACVGELHRLADLDSQERMRRLFIAANRANVSFYPVSPNGLAVFDVGAASERPGQALGLERESQRVRARVDGLRTLADNTDGIAIVNRNDTAVGMARIVDDISAYYLLGYYSTNPKADGRYRKIDVKLKQPGLTVHARRGYVAGAAPVTPAATAATGAAAVTPPAVDAALSVLGHARPGAELFIWGAASADRIVATVELAATLSATPPWVQGGVVDLDVRTPAGERVGAARGTIAAGARSVSIVVPLGASAGPWVLRAAATAGGTHLDSDQITVSAVSGLVGTPRMFRAALSVRAPLRPMADLQVRRTERLHVEWPVLKPLDRRGARLLDRRGQALPIAAALTERDVDGQPQLAADIALAPLAEGDYVLELSVGSGDDAARTLLAFRVVR